MILGGGGCGTLAGGLMGIRTQSAKHMASSLTIGNTMHLCLCADWLQVKQRERVLVFSGFITARFMREKSWSSNYLWMDLMCTRL